MSNNELIEITCEIIAETKLAVCIDDGDKKVWIPKSQIGNTEKLHSEDVVEISIPEWLAIEKELI